ncbi:MAG: 16S rRNA (cytosine(1402)-N(4))-methyltransferase RsmH [Candidatus Makana argininalis]
MNKKYFHKSVLLKESIKSLKIKPNGIYIDCTFGNGGHSKLILKHLNIYGNLISIDRDPNAIKKALLLKDKRFKIIHGNFSQIYYFFYKLDLIGKINGIIYDLGISSLQLDNPKRGFSFINKGPLDMRMNNTCGQSAYTWLLNTNIKDIEYVIKTYGEERFYKKIAKSINIFKKKKPLKNTIELSKIISKSIFFKNRFRNPATRTFQAIRIYINNEIEEISQSLKNIIKILHPGGRLSLISFHSIEHRLIKKFINKFSKKNQNKDFLNKNINKKKIKFLNEIKLKKILKIKPTKVEIKNNPRSRSAMLRVVEKLN